MSTVAISGLDAASTLDGSEQVEINQDDGGLASRRTTTGDIAGLVQVPNPTTVEINTETASYTLVSADAGKVVRMNSASAVNLTVPAEASVNYDVGTVIEVRQVGAGTVTVVEGSGVTVNIESGLTLDLRGQYASVSLHKVGSDTWEAVGGFAEDES